MKKLFIGIDVSKDVFDYCILEPQVVAPISKGVFTNTRKGIAEFCKHLEKLGENDTWICIEHTGHYGALLVAEFSVRDLRFSLINPLEIKHSVGMTRGKNDAIDAYRLASYGVHHSYKLEAYQVPSQQLQKLKALMTIRDGYVKIKVQLKNTLKVLEILSTSLPEIKSQIKKHKELINKQEKVVAEVEKEMLEIIKANPDLKQTYDKISQVIGVGPLTAMKCIIETENFQKFIKGRKFSCHCGLAPFDYQSGSSIRGRTRTSPLSNKSLKAILFKAASTAIQHDPQLQQYYTRKVAEGKHKLSVLNAVANKIVLRIFAVAMRTEPFVKLSA